ncbi:hypothetical protein AD998_01955 [bacterium 336/3]|nr:hypothetical protein AD998_01955 [bacterium 336/3]
MKKILILLALIAFQANAQIPTSNFTVNGQTFLVKNLSNTLVITNSQSPIKSGEIVPTGNADNECYNQLIKNDFYRFFYRKEDFLRFYNILREVFPSRRILQFGSNKTIDFEFQISTQGRLLEIKYQFAKTLPITTQEIALLDKRLKESMSFTLKPNNICIVNGHTVFSYDWDMRFEQIHDSFGHGQGEEWEYHDDKLRRMIDDGEDPRN